MTSSPVLDAPFYIADLPEKLRAGQEKAIPALIDHFAEQDRGILWMCCGSGKTVACAINIELRGEPLTVVFTPYIHLVKQWRDDYLKWLPTTEAKFMCVCSEKDPAYEMDPLEKGRFFNAAAEASAEEFAELVAAAEESRGQKYGETKVSTNPEEIATFLKQKGRKVVFSTYASSPVYGEAQRLAKIHAGYGVFDEAQWTATGEKDTESTYALHNKNVRIDQRLFTTATVRHYTRDGMAYSMDNEAIYGGHVLVDAQGNPDPWTTRQAIEHRESPPYRIVLSFVTDPSLNPQLVQLPPYQTLLADIGGKADSQEVLRLIGQAVATERIKEKYGIKKPLGFFNSVATARLYTNILNACKKYPELFPNLSTSDPAISISNYELPKERRKRVEKFHTSLEIEVNNARLYIFGASEDTIDAIHFGDPMTSDIYTVQACGRAQRFVEGKVATFVVPVMLPYYGNELATHAGQIDKDQIKDAFRKVVDILDSLSDMDPILRDQIFSGRGVNNGDPGIVEFDFPETFLPELRQAISVEAWRTINPDTDFIDNLERDAAALSQYRFEQYPVLNDPVEEAKAAKLRSQIRMIPQKQKVYEGTAIRMALLRKAIKAYYEAGEKEGTYNGRIVTANRIEQVYQIYGWDKKFILQDDFEELLKQDAAALAEYRLKKYPTQDDPEKEAQASLLRAQIRIMPQEKGHESISWRMKELRQSIRSYFEGGEREGSYNSRAISAGRVEQICLIYGWDREFILQDDFEELLKQDSAALDKYRWEQYPAQDDSEREAKAAQARAEIRILPHGRKGYETGAHRMGSLRKTARAYYEAGEKEGFYKLYTMNAARIKQIYQIYGWDKDFILRDDFEEQLKQNTIALDQYRWKKYPKQTDLSEEAKAIQARAEIKIIPGKTPAATQMQRLRKALRAYYEAREKEGRYSSYVITAKRIEQVQKIYGWDKAFIIEDNFEGRLKQDAAMLVRYRLEQYPARSDAEEETIASELRSRIKIVPQSSRTYNAISNRMACLRQAIRAYFEAGEKKGKYKSHNLDAGRVQKVFEFYGWDKDFILEYSGHGPRRTNKSREEHHYHMMPAPSSMLIEPVHRLTGKRQSFVEFLP